MKFPKLHLVCSNDDLRPTLNCVCVNKEFTYATNANILVRHKSSEIFEEDFISSLPDKEILIPATAISIICKKSTLKISLTDDKQQIKLHQVDGSIIFYNLYDDGCVYPNCEKIIPDENKYCSIDKIAINAKLLFYLSEGLGCNVPIMKMYFYGPSKAILVKSEYCDYVGAIGIIMPCMINE